MFYANGSVYITLNNCLFDIPGNFVPSYINYGSNYLSIVNCASTKNIIDAHTQSTNLTNITIDSNYNITSSGWKNTGSGTNPDGTQANIGVYGGAFAWGISPPATPSTLTATATACNQVQLSWQPNTESDLAGYIIYRNYVEIARVGATATSYTDTGVQPNTQYTYGIKAYNTSSMTSGMSNAATVTTPLPPTPTGLAINNVTSTGAVASWDPVSGADSYNVYINGSPAYNTTQTQYQITGLNPGTSYTVQVAAVMGGVQSDLATASFTTNTGPPPPATPSTLTATATAYNQVKLSWQPNTESDLAGYIIYRNYVEIARVRATTTSYTDNGLQPGTQYTYGIRAYNTENVTSGMSNAATVTTPVNPNPALTAAVDNHNINLSWTGTADNFLVKVNDQQVASTTANHYTYNAQPGTYKVQVVAVIGSEQYPSNPANVTVSQFSTPGAGTMTGDLLKNTGLVMLPLGGIIALALALKGSPMLIAAVKGGMFSKWFRGW